MQVKVKIFEDYKIFGDEIYPVGYYQDKTLNSNDIRNALKSFLKIKTSKDAVNFARKYGLLNGYDLWAWWYFSKKGDVFGFTKLYAVSKKNKKGLSCDDCIYGRIIHDTVEQVGNFDYEKIRNTIQRLEDILDITSVLTQIEFKLFVEGEINTFYRDDNKNMYTSLYLMRKCHDNSVKYYLPYDMSFSYLKSNNSILAADDRFYSKDVYIDYILFFLQKLYEKNKTTMSLDYFYSCIGETLGLNIKDRNTWVSYQNKLLDYAKDVKVLTDSDVSKGERIDDLTRKNKRFSKQVTLDYSYKKQKDGKYVLSSDITFKSLYDALEWAVISAGDFVKVCKHCGKVFLASRKDQDYCNVNCRNKAKYHRNMPTLPKNKRLYVTP